MRIVDIITKKRDGGELSQAEIKYFVAGYVAGDIPDYQAAAWCMAVFFRSMTPAETAHLTEAMAFSGATLDLHDVAPFIVDKHSSGGVGDKTTLVVGPIAAGLGVPVGKMSGRGLSFSGGTLDKLESIPGMRVDLSIEEFREQLRRVGLVVTGQTHDLAPADGKLYALRDVTGTVESIPLITASIMSKKIAEGIDALVLDVKTGRGAFMKTLDDSRRLARSLVETGTRSGVRTEAFITAMDAPLGRAVGNALEVIECVETLKGRGPKDLEDLSVRLAARMVLLAGLAGSAAEAEARVREALTSGRGVEKWREIVAEQGGDVATVDDYSRLPSVATRHVVTAGRSGWLSALDAELVGRATVALGAGRNTVDDAVDPAVGAMVLARPGDAVKQGDPILELHYRREADLGPALELLRPAIEIGDEPCPVGPVVIEEVL